MGEHWFKGCKCNKAIQNVYEIWTIPIANKFWDKLLEVMYETKSISKGAIYNSHAAKVQKSQISWVGKKWSKWK